MSDLEKLRELAERADQGEWHAGHIADDAHPCNCDYVLSDSGYMGSIARISVDNGLPISEGGNDSPPLEEAKANLRFIAAANPATVLALLDALATSQARISALEAELGEVKAERDEADKALTVLKANIRLGHLGENGRLAEALATTRGALEKIRDSEMTVGFETFARIVARETLLALTGGKQDE